MKYNKIILNKWLRSKDSYGNNVVEKWEVPFIRKRLDEIKNLVVFEGNLKTDMPNVVLVDITDLKERKFQPGKKIIISLAHFIRPCSCEECDHVYQYECYLKDCECCTDECT